MADHAESDGVPYRRLATDPSLIAVFAVSAVAALGTNAVPVALPSIGTALTLTETQIGLVMSVFSLPIMLMVPVTGVVADVYGRRVVVIPSLVVMGLAGIATLGVTSFPALLAIRAVQGTAFAGTLPLTTTLTGDLYTGTEGSSAQGMRSGLNGLSSAIAPIVAGVLAVIAWQYPFVLFGLAIPVAALVYRYYPEPIDRDETADGLAELRYALVTYVSTLREQAADRTLAILLGGGFTLFFLKQAFRTFVPVFVVTGIGASVTAAGYVLGVYGVVRVVVSPLAGSVMGRLGRKRSMLLGISMAVAGTVIVPFAPAVWWVGVGAGVYGIGEAVLNPVVNDAVATFAGDEQRAGIMSGLQLLKNFALTLAPTLMGFILAGWGYVPAFLAAAAIGVVYFVVVALRFAPTAETFAQ